MSAARRSSWWARFRNRSLPWLGLSAAVILVALGVSIARPSTAARKTLEITAGNSKGMRTRVASLLAEAALPHGLELQSTSTGGSREGLQRVNDGEIQLALVQGGLRSTDYPNVRRIATLHVEPLHLLVRKNVYSTVAAHLMNLRGKRINLSSASSGTSELATELLAFLHLSADEYTATHLSYQELTDPDLEELPEAIFTVSSLPSPVAQYLIEERGYRLVALPFAESFQLHWFESSGSSDVNRQQVSATQIPPFCYMADPPRPEQAIETFGTRLELVGNASVSQDVANRLCLAIYDSDFGNIFGKRVTPELLKEKSSFVLHEGTRRYLDRQQPVSSGRVIELTEQLVGILGAAIGAMLFVWQWLKRTRERRRDREFVGCVQRVVEIETRALRFEQEAAMSVDDLEKMQNELGDIKSELIERYRNGELEGADMLSAFLKHANDASELISRIVLHETAPKPIRDDTDGQDVSATNSG